MSWTIVKSETAKDRALSQARGCYQRNLIHGRESLSGSTLRGKAARYSGAYKRSRENLLGRMTAAGVRWGEVRGKRNKRILVIG